jgi:HNH endonuclease
MTLSLRRQQLRFDRRISPMNTDSTPFASPRALEVSRGLTRGGAFFTPMVTTCETVKTPRINRSAAQRTRLNQILHHRDNGLCGICGTKVKEWGPDVQTDHVIPLSKGGSDSEDNMQRVHTYCNQRKGGRIQ